MPTICIAKWGRGLQVSIFTAERSFKYVCLCVCACSGILLACKDKSASSSSVKIEALTFLRAALEANPAAVFTPHVAQLSTGTACRAHHAYDSLGPHCGSLCFPHSTWPLIYWSRIDIPPELFFIR
jgi:hypothetical protein